MSSSGGGGGARVSIPGNIMQTIQTIKDVVTGKHSDDDIYTVLQDCNMDPTETIQKLMYLDTFHEVKKKRDRKKVNVNKRGYEESSWTGGTHGRGFRGGRGNYSSSYISDGAGNGRDVSVQKDDGVGNRVESGSRPSLSVPEKTQNNANPRVPSSLGISVNGPKRISNGSSSHERVPQLPADPVVVPPLNSGISVVGAEVNCSRIAAGFGASNPTGTRSSTAHGVANNIKVAFGDVTTTKMVLKESQIVEKNQPLEPSQPSTLTTSHGSLEAISIQDGKSSQQLIGPSKVIAASVASEAATLAVEAGSQSLPQLNVSVLEEATSKLDRALEKLNITAHQPVIFPDHLRVPDDFKNGLTFGSLDAAFEQSIECLNTPDDTKESMPATELLAPELLQENDEATRGISPSNLSVSSTAREGDYPDSPHSLSHVPDNSSHLEEKVSPGATPKYDQSKQEIMLPQGGPQYPFVHAAPTYGFPFIQPMLGSHLVQYEGPEPQSGSSLVSSTSGSTPSATQPAGVGQSSIAVSPPPFPVFRQPYPPNYFPFGPYFPPYYLASNNALQMLGHSGFAQQPTTGNVYLSPSAASPGVKFSVPQGKPGINSGNPSQFATPSGYGSYIPGLAVTSGSSAGNEDLAASELKENSVYTTVQQGEGPPVWYPASGRDISNLYANSFYNQLPPPQAGHGPYVGIYPPEQRMTAHPLMQQSQAMAGSVETVGSSSGAYQQPQHAIN